MLFPVSAVVVGLILLVFSADHFVTASAALARRLGMSALLVGMIIVGFGTSAPELLVSAMSTLQGAYGIAVGNAWGSNIANIALILGVTAVISPIAVHSRVIRRELPILFVVTVLAAIQAYDSRIARWEGVALLFVFLGILGWSIRENRRSGDDPFAAEVELLVNAGGVSAPPDSPGTGMGAQSSTTTTILRIIVSLAILVGASRLLVWGAVEIARAMGISDLIIGLTVIAVGTSLPELASSIAAARKGRKRYRPRKHHRFQPLQYNRRRRDFRRYYAAHL